jgi:hypothetical protein
MGGYAAVLHKNDDLILLFNDNEKNYDPNKKDNYIFQSPWAGCVSQVIVSPDGKMKKEMFVENKEGLVLRQHGVQFIDSNHLFMSFKFKAGEMVGIIEY